MNKCPHTSALVFPTQAFAHMRIDSMCFRKKTVFVQTMTHSNMFIISEDLHIGG